MITLAFFTNFALGFVLAIEFGQTSIEIFRRGLRHGLKAAMLVSAGGAFADFIYLNVAIGGILVFLNRPEILKILWVVGGVTVTYLAINGIRDSLKETEINDEQQGTNPFIAGFLLNFAHPLNLIYWVTILSSLLVKDIQKNSFLTAYIDGMGIPLGVFAWWVLLSVLSSVGRTWITPKIMRRISLVSSIVLLGFAIWFFFNALK